MKRNFGIDGLRGVAALSVVLSHCFLTFWPYLHGASFDRLTPSWQIWIFNSPFTFFFNGTFAVFLFFVLSGYVLSIQFFQTGDCRVIQSLFLRRYLRLAIPVTASILFMYILAKFHAFTVTTSELKDWALFSYQTTPTLTQALNAGLIKSIFLGDSSYNYVLWTMSIEYFGSFLVFSNCLFLNGIKNKLFFYLTEIIFLFFILGNNSYYYISFIIGLFLAEFKSKNTEFKIKFPFLFLFLFLFGAYFGGDHYSSFSYNIINVVNINIFYIIGSVFFVFTVLFNSKIESLFCLKIPHFLGKISFSLYLVHSFVLRSLGIYVFNALRNIEISYNIASVISTFIVILSSILIAIPFNFFDKFGIYCSRKIDYFYRGINISRT